MRGSYVGIPHVAPRELIEALRKPENTALRRAVAEAAFDAVAPDGSVTFPDLSFPAPALIGDDAANECPQATIHAMVGASPRCPRPRFCSFRLIWKRTRQFIAFNIDDLIIMGFLDLETFVAIWVRLPPSGDSDTGSIETRRAAASARGPTSSAPQSRVEQHSKIANIELTALSK